LFWQKHLTPVFIINKHYMQPATQKEHAMPPQNPPGVADAGRGRRSHPAAQHHVATRRPYPPFF